MIPDLPPEALQAFPATQLFLERAAAGGATFDLNDAEAAIAARICRKLDGVPLAIELAAKRVEAFGLRQIDQLLDQSMAFQWPGFRTAPPRQKTLQATLRWSYELLSEIERAVLRRLAVFVGDFSIDAVLATMRSTALDETAVFHAVDGLVEKSMVATRPIGAKTHYRLLDTTRAYALEMSAGDHESR